MLPPGFMQLSYIYLVPTFIILLFYGIGFYECDEGFDAVFLLVTIK